MKILPGIVALLLLSTPVWAQRSGSTSQTPPGPLPQATITPLPSDAPAPWGTDPATIPGATISDTIRGNGFLQETVSLQNGSRFFFQSISTTDFSVDSYVKRAEGSNNDPTGNIIFNQTLKDPAWGLTDHSFINGFKQPIQLHFNIVESKVAALGGTGFNQLDMFFRQQPFLDTATGKVRIRQDVGVWITGFRGLQSHDVSEESHNFVPRESILSHVIAKTIPTGGSRDGGEDGGRGPINFWNDLTVVKNIDPVTNQIVNFSRCNDFGDPSGRGDDFEFANDRRSRGGCNASASTSTARPGIPNHDSEGFQLTPVWWDRWGGAGSGSLNTSGFNTVFPGTGSGGGR
ncbi:hypothetical protein [Candidatus Manganitrophus noduliformans]|uniref:Uncharacterized protein n=1 Tax=Candidatus Manganitrophus noduliformans TaxID=2606439 RepID=A0A7X6DVN9_9BACT|nr:hypothetical protein [Candidatus Manganitrophus noduliformans]NKE73789.1 hypothetical protein [Candidatus Manganitrophus noduliformans]